MNLVEYFLLRVCHTVGDTQVNGQFVFVQKLTEAPGCTSNPLASNGVKTFLLELIEHLHVTYPM